MSNQALNARARTTLTHRQSANYRQNIRVGEIISRMDRFFHAVPEYNDRGQIVGYTDQKGNSIAMTKDQIAAGQTLLSKALPDLKQVEVHNRGETRSYAEITAALDAMVKANPEKVLESLAKADPARLERLMNTISDQRANQQAIEGETDET